MNSVNVWTTPEGEHLVIPDDVYAATKFAKSGWPDKRVKANAAFWEWLAKAALAESMRLDPPKACPECGQAVGHYDDCTIGITGPTHNGDTSREPEDLIELPVREMHPDVAKFVGNDAVLIVDRSKDREHAQAYAERVWSGQSVSAEREWRIQRVKEALAGQSLPFDGVILP
jgi:hypothetical protein